MRMFATLIIGYPVGLRRAPDFWRKVTAADLCNIAIM